MKHFFLILALSVGLSVSAQICQIERATPEACGIPSETITRYFDSLMVIPRTSIHNVMILRHDKVVAEIHSLSAMSIRTPSTAVLRRL